MVEVSSVAGASLPVVEDGGFHGSRKSGRRLVCRCRDAERGDQCYCPRRDGRRGSRARCCGVTVFIPKHDAVLRPVVHGQPPESS